MARWADAAAPVSVDDELSEGEPMRRTAVVLLVLALVLLTPAPALASTTVVRQYFPDELVVATLGCATAEATALTRLSDSGVGRGALRLQGNDGQATINRDLTTLGGLTAWSALVKSPDTLGTNVSVDLPDTVGYALVSTTAGAWTALDLEAAPLTWSQNGQPLGDATLPAFLEAHPAYADAPANVKVGVFSCGGGTDLVWLDDLRYTIDGTESAYDFEPPIPVVLIQRAPFRVKYGEPVTVTASMLVYNTRLTGRVDLWAAPLGTDSITRIGHVDLTKAEPKGSLTVRPRRNTSYQWRYPDQGTYEAAVSNKLPVRVSPRLSLALTDATVRHGHPTSVHGAIKPALGQVVTLYRKSTTGRLKLATTTVHADGTWSITFTPGRAGTWTLLATVGPKGGLDGARSPLRTLTVR